MASQVRLFDLLKKGGPLHDLYEPYWDPDYFNEANMRKRNNHVDTVPIMQKIRQYMASGTTFIGHSSGQSKAIFCSLIDVCDELNMSYAKYIHQTGTELTKDVIKIVNIMKSKLKPVPVMVPDQPDTDVIDPSILVYNNFVRQMEEISRNNEQNIDRITMQEQIDSATTDRHETTQDINASINDSFLGNILEPHAQPGQQGSTDTLQGQIIPVPQEVSDTMEVTTAEPSVPRDIESTTTERTIPQEIQLIQAEQRVPSAEPVLPQVPDIEVQPQVHEIQPVPAEQQVQAVEPTPEIEPAVPITPYVVPDMQPPNIGFFPTEQLVPVDQYVQVIPPDEDEPAPRPLFIREPEEIPPRDEETRRRIPVQPVQPVENVEFVGAELVRARLPTPPIQDAREVIPGQPDHPPEAAEARPVTPQVPGIVPEQPDHPPEPAQARPVTPQVSGIVPEQPDHPPELVQPGTAVPQEPVVAPGELDQPTAPELPTVRDEARAPSADLPPPAGTVSPPALIEPPVAGPSRATPVQHDAKLLLRFMKGWAENAVSRRVLSVSIDDVCEQNDSPASKWDVHASSFRLCDLGLLCINPQNDNRLRLTQGPRLTEIFKNLSDRSS